MKKTVFILFALCALFACSPSEEPQAVACARLASVSLTEGEQVYAEQLSAVTLTYFRTVASVKAPCAMLNGTPLTGTISPDNAMQVVLQLPVLEEKTQYTLSIDSGAIMVDYTQQSVAELRPCEAFTLHFSTKESKQHTFGGLSNPDAIPSAVKVYDYLKEQFGQKILSSSIANVDWNFAEAELVHKATGKYPAIATMDFLQMYTMTSHSPYKGGWVVHYDDISAVQQWWNNNGLLSACWHWNMPADASSIYETTYTCTPGKTSVKPSDIMNPNSWVYPVAKEDLDKMVSLLLQLQNAGIPLIWRPFHEASGNTYGQWAGGGAWFWWGIEGAEKYKELWRYMYDYFKQAGVNNLIWVWTSQNNGDTDWYPGDEYVDIVGQDIYNQGAASNAADYIRLQATYPNKIVTLSECGNVGKISEQWAAGARWSYFMPWYQYNATTLDKHEHANTDWWKDAMSCPYVISREQLPSLK